MIHVVFTLDYEIYGNGEGTLRDLVLEPTQRLADAFDAFRAPFVVFAEAVEFARMREAESDPDIEAVASQLRSLRTAGHEIALHLHPWWARARYEGGEWQLDWSERNICELSVERMDTIVKGAIDYLRSALSDPCYAPLSFRSGLWLMQPTQPMADVLVRYGVRIDSSVFKGGRTRDAGLDYRPALRNGNYWRFGDDVNTPDPLGPLLELPIHTRMVPFWAMLRRKRLKLHGRVPGADGGNPLPRRWRDYLRFSYPQKLDFCRMTFQEMRSAVLREIRSARLCSEEPSWLVAIGHSKDLVDFEAISTFLSFLQGEGVSITTFSSGLARELASESVQ